MHTTLTIGRSIWLLPLSLSLFWLSCQEPLSEVAQKREAIQRLIAQPQQQQTYSFSEGEGQTLIETQWSQIERKGPRYVYLEVYSTYTTETGRKEYNLFEFQFEPDNLGARFPILEYELRIDQDSAWFAQPDQLQGSLDGLLISGQDSLFRILGFAHEGDVAPGHMRYWSPTYGNVLVWYGEDRYFELIQPYQGLDTTRLTLLKGIAFQDTQQQ
ncbi:MAG: hypothetical protein AAFQ87_17495 [Bacteroidota bacterium]